MRIHELLVENPQQQGLPQKIEPVRHQWPQRPNPNAQKGDQGDGTTIGITRNSNLYLKGGSGTFVWDGRSGQPLAYVSPTVDGVHQVHDAKTGNITVNYEKGALKLTGQYDKQGNKIQGTGSANYQVGNVGLSSDEQGNRSATQVGQPQAGR